MRAQRQTRREWHRAGNFFSFLRRVEGLMVAVQNRAGADHVYPSAGARADGSAIGHVYDARRNSVRAQTIEAIAEELLLLGGLFGGEIFSRGEMGVGAFELDVGATG